MVKVWIEGFVTMRGADREMLGDEVDEEHEQTAGDEAGVEVPLRRALLALPGLHLAAAAHGNFLLPPLRSALCTCWLCLLLKLDFVTRYYYLAILH